MSDKDLAESLFRLIPEDGTSIGNKSLREEFRAIDLSLDDDDYWRVRDRLITEKRIKVGRGQGGSVSRVVAEPDQVAPCDLPEVSLQIAVRTEADLYDPFLETIRTRYVKDYQIGTFVVEKTARQGSRSTGGKWTRPDISLVGIFQYEYIPGKDIEVITFEIKAQSGYDIDAVYEAAAHTAFAHRSYLALEVPNLDEAPSITIIERVQRECERFGVGLIIFADPANWEKFEVIVEAKLQRPEPRDVDTFIGTQLSPENCKEIRKGLR